MVGSTIYCQCPGCGRDTLAGVIDGAYRCTSCSFDYTALATDQAKREQWLLDNLRRGPMFQLAVVHLYRHLMLVPAAQANAEIVAFAERNGVKLSTGKAPSRVVILGAVVLGVALLAVLAVLLFR